jgi:hypothetical protein
MFACWSADESGSMKGSSLILRRLIINIPSGAKQGPTPLTHLALSISEPYCVLRFLCFTIRKKCHPSVSSMGSWAASEPSPFVAGTPLLTLHPILILVHNLSGCPCFSLIKIESMQWGFMPRIVNSAPKSPMINYPSRLSSNSTTIYSAV